MLTFYPAAITPNSAPCLKRRAVSPEMGSDSENVDPNLLDSLHKRKRSLFEDDVTASKSHRYSLNVTNIPSTKRRLDLPSATTPRLDTFVKHPAPTPVSAPAAGRSPTRQRQGLLQPRKRFNPPSFSGTSPLLSISAALSGTKKSRQERQARKAHHRSSSTIIEDAIPKSWCFDIFEESQETQDYRMNEWTMTQSATGLDISDDEGKSTSKSPDRLDRGKENIDPDQPSVTMTRSMAATAAAAAAAKKEQNANAMLEDEARTPLGDLNPAEFYTEGLNAASVVLVHDDDAEAETDIEDETKPESHDSGLKTSSLVPSRTARVIESLDTPSLSQILGSATPNISCPRLTPRSTMSCHRTTLTLTSGRAKAPKTRMEKATWCSTPMQLNLTWAARGQ